MRYWVLVLGGDVLLRVVWSRLRELLPLEVVLGNLLERRYPTDCWYAPKVRLPYISRQ